MLRGILHRQSLEKLLETETKTIIDSLSSLINGKFDMMIGKLASTSFIDMIRMIS